MQLQIGLPFLKSRWLFEPRLVPTLMSLAFIFLFISLGRWQWQRADFKEGLYNNYLRGEQSAPLTIESVILLGADANSFPVAVEGRFDNAHNILLDNQVESRVVGFHVFTPLITAQRQILLVDRGWMPLGKDREHVTPIPPLEEKIFRVSGKVYFPSKKQFVLKEDNFLNVQWPLLVQKLDLTEIGKVLGVELAPFVVRLNNDQQVESGQQLVRHWKFMVMGPEKSRGYSFQWYGMAVVLFMFYCFFSVEKVRDND